MEKEGTEVMKQFSRYFLEDFVEIQRQSFFRFLRDGIPNEFAKRNPITTKTKDLELFFFGDYYQLAPPEHSPKDVLINGKTYASKLYIPVQFIDHLQGKIHFKWIFLANLPLMTKRGHFLINGAPRVIMNQIVRSPGIYYHQKFEETLEENSTNKADQIAERFYADFICERGTWLRLEMDKEKAIWAQFKKGPKMPMLWLLLAFGLSDKFVFSKIPDSKILLKNFQRKKHQKVDYAYVSDPPGAWKELYNLMFTKKLPDEERTIELGRKWLFRKFLNPRTYDLGIHGRRSLNQKFGLTLSITQTTLTAQDLLAATHYLIELQKGFKKIDDIDHLKNRRVRTSGDLLQVQFGIGLLRLEKNIREKFLQYKTQYQKYENAKIPRPTLNLSTLLQAKFVNGALKEFFGTNPLSQFMDQINPLSEITHKRRLSSMGPGGVTRDTATLAIRGIHPSHYGRICPIETPEGKNTGLVNSLTAYSKVTSFGQIHTPFYKVYLGQVQKQNGFIFLSSEEEEKYYVAAGDVAISATGFLPSYKIPSRFENAIVPLSANKIQFLAVSPTQLISVATSLIPFLEHDDANRALMGSNMQRQAVPLIRPQRPIVGTGLEPRVVSDSGHALQTDSSGFIGYVSSKKIVVYTKNSKN